MKEQELREKIANYVLNALCYPLLGFDQLVSMVVLHFDIPTIKAKTIIWEVLIKEALPKLAKEAGYVKLAENRTRRREQSLLEKLDPYKQALNALYGVEHFGDVSQQAVMILSDLSSALRKGVADAVKRMHQHYYKKSEMPQHLFQVMKDIYGEDGWFI